MVAAILEENLPPRLATMDRRTPRFRVNRSPFRVFAFCVLFSLSFYSFSLSPPPRVCSGAADTAAERRVAQGMKGDEAFAKAKRLEVKNKWDLYFL